MSCNPGDRRDRQGHGRARGRRARRGDGAGDRSRPDPVPDAQPVEGPGGLVAAGAMRPRAVSTRRTFPIGTHANARVRAGDGRRAAAGGGVECRAWCTSDGRRFEARVGRAHGRHVPARPDPSRARRRRLPAGRAGERPSVEIAEALKLLDLRSKDSRPARRRESTAARSTSLVSSARTATGAAIWFSVS